MYTFWVSGGAGAGVGGRSTSALVAGGTAATIMTTAALVTKLLLAIVLRGSAALVKDLSLIHI